MSTENASAGSQFRFWEKGRNRHIMKNNSEPSAKTSAPSEPPQGGQPSLKEGISTAVEVPLPPANHSPGATAASDVVRLTYTTREACIALGIGVTTLWRLEKRGLIRSVPGIRHKLYPRANLIKFVEGKTG